MAVQADVGKWVRRTYRTGSKWHLVESIFIGEHVTKCGSFMAERDSRGHEVQIKDPRAGVTVVPSRVCRNCFR